MDDIGLLLARTDAILARRDISEMNILLCELGEETQLDRQLRYQLQQKLRAAIADRGRTCKEDVDIARRARRAAASEVERSTETV